MERVPTRRVVTRLAVAGALMACSLGVHVARGDDLVTLSGTTYHDVRPVRVEPDGVTWEYAEGMCKVDFTDSPESVRQVYHYDAAKAAAYHDALLRERQQADAQKQQVLQENEARRQARMRSVAAAANAPGGMDVIFRRGASPAASDATRAMAAQAAAAEAKRAAAGPAIKGVTDTKIGSVLTNLGILHLSHPAEVLNPDEFKTNLHHAPSDASAPDTARNEFFTPVYSTKSYYDDVDRSEAFLRGVPLKQ